MTRPSRIHPTCRFLPLPLLGERSSFQSRCVVAFIGLVTVALLGYMYADSLLFMMGQWGRDDYSHGPFIPIISAVLIWHHRHQLAKMTFEPSWWGTMLLLPALLLYVAGNVSTLYVISHLSLWLMIVGLALSFLGIKALQELTFPLAYLLTAIPLPIFLYNSLSAQLQLWSSALGVGVLHFIGVTAFREGNVIDLGPVQLQVAEACSGIRYLFPLTALALLCAYFFRDRMWKRIVLVLSAFPISVLVNGVRIGMVGVLVEWYGPQAAEGFLHLFEGWVLFLTTLGILFAEMWALSRVQSLPGSRGISHFQIYDNSNAGSSAMPSSGPGPSAPNAGFIFPAYVASMSLLACAALFGWSMGDRQERPPARAALMDFAMRIGNWHGNTLPVEPQLISTLRFDDYLLADYAESEKAPVTLYMAYYRSQRNGRSAHSPSSCIPGGGWEITSHDRVILPADGRAIPVNRVLIQKDREKQLVLYWFKQRDRQLASEYSVKWYLLWDALTKQRSDGALIRLSASVLPGEAEKEVEHRILQLARQIQPQLTRYIPD